MAGTASQSFLGSEEVGVSQAKEERKSGWGPWVGDNDVQRPGVRGSVACLQIQRTTRGQGSARLRVKIENKGSGAEPKGAAFRLWDFIFQAEKNR